VMGQ